MSDKLLELYGYEIEMNLALHAWHETLCSWTTRPDLCETLKQEQTITFGKGNPNTRDAKWHYERNYDYLLDASRKNGLNAQIHRRAVIAMAYALWEDHYRTKVALECGYNSKNDIQSDVFADLNKYRQAVLHAGGILRQEPKANHLFTKGESILLSGNHMHELFTILLNGLNEIGETYYGKNPWLVLDKLTLTPNSGPGGSSPMRPERWSCPSWPVPASGSRCSSGAVVGYRRSRCTRIAQPWPRVG